MTGKTKRRLQLEQVFMHYRDEDGKKHVIKLRISGLDAVIISREVADKVRPHFPPGDDDPEEPVNDEVKLASTADTRTATNDDDDDGFTGNCYIVNGRFICV